MTSDSFKGTSHQVNYVDIFSFAKYSFGYGLSYTNFSTANFNATSSGGVNTFTAGETIQFHVDITNEGDMSGSYVLQVSIPFCSVPRRIIQTTGRSIYYSASPRLRSQSNNSSPSNGSILILERHSPSLWSSRLTDICLL
jgi:hypothetical protein